VREKDALLTEKESEMSEKDALLTEKEKELLVIRGELCDKERRLRENHEFLSVSESQLLDIKAQLAEKEVSFTVQEWQLSSAKAAITEKIAVLEENEAKLIELELRVAEKEKLITDVSFRLISKESEVEELSAELDRKDDELTKAFFNLDEKRIELTDAEHSIASLKAKILGVEASVEKFNTQLATKDADITRLEVFVDNAREEMAIKTTVAEELRNQLQSERIVRKKAEEELQTTLTTLGTANEKCGIFEEELNRLLNEIRHRDDEIQLSLEEKDKILDELRESQKSCSDLFEQRRNLCNDNRNLVIEVEYLTAELKEAEESLSVKEKVIDRLQNNAHESHLKAVAEQEKVTQLTSALSDITAQLEKEHNNLVSMQAKCHHYQLMLEVQTRVVERLQQQLIDINTKIEELEANRAKFILAASNVGNRTNDFSEPKVANAGISVPKGAPRSRPFRPKNDSVLVVQRDFIEENKRNVQVLNKALLTLSEREASSSYIKAHVAHHVLHAVAPLIVEKEIPMINIQLQQQQQQLADQLGSSSHTATPARRRPSATPSLDSYAPNVSVTMSNGDLEGLLSSRSNSRLRPSQSTDSTPIIRRFRSASVDKARLQSMTPGYLTRRRTFDRVEGEDIDSSITLPSPSDCLSPEVSSYVKRRGRSWVMSPSRARRALSADDSGNNSFKISYNSVPKALIAAETPPSVKLRPRMSHILANKAEVKRTSDGVGVLRRLQKEDDSATSMNTVALAQMKRKIIHETRSEFMHSDHQSLGHMDEESLKNYVVHASGSGFKSSSKLNLIYPSLSTGMGADDVPPSSALLLFSSSLSSGISTPIPDAFTKDDMSTKNAGKSPHVTQQQRPPTQRSRNSGNVASTANLSSPHRLNNKNRQGSLNTKLTQLGSSTAVSVDVVQSSRTASENAEGMIEIIEGKCVHPLALRRTDSSTSDLTRKDFSRLVSLDDFLSFDGGDVHVTQVDDEYHDDETHRSRVRYDIHQQEHAENSKDHHFHSDEDDDEDDRSFLLPDVPLTPTLDRIKSIDSTRSSSGRMFDLVYSNTAGMEEVSASRESRNNSSFVANASTQSLYGTQSAGSWRQGFGEASFAGWTASEESNDSPNQQQVSSSSYEEQLTNSHISTVPKPVTSQIPVRKGSSRKL
jgi:uncharacterized coiled-coil protein SlyX